MSGYVWWFVLAFGLLIAELVTGTFYLLVISLALTGAGVAHLLRAAFAVQLGVAAPLGRRCGSLIAAAMTVVKGRPA